jgi:hypothetical protein
VAFERCRTVYISQTVRTCRCGAALSYVWCARRAQLLASVGVGVMITERAWSVKQPDAMSSQPRHQPLLTLTTTYLAPVRPYLPLTRECTLGFQLTDCSRWHLATLTPTAYTLAARLYLETTDCHRPRVATPDQTLGAFNISYDNDQ